MAVHAPHQAGQATVEEVGPLNVVAPLGRMPVADEGDLQASVEVGDLLEVAYNGIEVVVHLGEDGFVWGEDHRRACAVAGLRRGVLLQQAGGGQALPVLLGVDGPVPADLNPHV